MNEISHVLLSLRHYEGWDISIEVTNLSGDASLRGRYARPRSNRNRDDWPGTGRNRGREAEPRRRPGRREKGKAPAHVRRAKGPGPTTREGEPPGGKLPSSTRIEAKNENRTGHLKGSDPVSMISYPIRSDPISMISDQIGSDLIPMISNQIGSDLIPTMSDPIQSDLISVISNLIGSDPISITSDPI